MDNSYLATKCSKNIWLDERSKFQETIAVSDYFEVNSTIMIHTHATLNSVNILSNY